MPIFQGKGGGNVPMAAGNPLNAAKLRGTPPAGVSAGQGASRAPLLSRADLAGINGIRTNPNRQVGARTGNMPVQRQPNAADLASLFMSNRPTPAVTLPDVKRPALAMPTLPTTPTTPPITGRPGTGTGQPPLSAPPKPQPTQPTMPAGFRQYGADPRTGQVVDPRFEGVWQAPDGNVYNSRTGQWSPGADNYGHEMNGVGMSGPVNAYDPAVQAFLTSRQQAAQRPVAPPQLSQAALLAKQINERAARRR